MQQIIRLITYLFIALVVWAALYFTQKSNPVVPHGIYLAATQTTALPAQDPATVTIYKTMPAQGQVLGVINASMSFSTISQTSEQNVLDYAIQVAAEHGANALVVQFFFASNEENMPQYIFRAQAVKV